ncbi:MAG TPA: tRNA lysidine(34) synthetase TilS, partial [Thermoanaerobaculia bacterium]|nr:tRNA lysidine(34) synthetase TilS [Thermoanaerobaculia bacterium]
AHQADDQAETVLLRLLLGSGIAGLGGMRARRGAVVRPLLALSRATLRAAVTAAGLSPVEDPTNQDLAVPRNRLRHALLPALGGEIVATPALALGAAAARARATIERRVAELLPALASSSALAEASAAPALEWEPNPTSAPSCSLPLAALRRLPPELLPWALALLHRRAERPYPPRRRAVAELRRQLAAGQRIACPCGGGWCWRSDADGALSLRPPAAAATPAFAYTVDVPGGVEIREAGTTFRLTQQPVAPWMRHGSPVRAALDLPLAAGEPVTVRSRRPGDRLQPFGSSHHRRLKDLLIDRKVPRVVRQRLPLLCVGGQVAWVPGITIHHPFRLREGATMAWVAELLPRADDRNGIRR